MNIKNWLKKLFLWKKKPSKLYIIALHNAIEECNHNIVSGVGNQNCPFQLKFIGDLLLFPEANEYAGEFLKICYAAHRCNANLGNEKPGSVKNEFVRLRERLLSEKEKLNGL